MKMSLCSFWLTYEMSRNKPFSGLDSDPMPETITDKYNNLKSLELYVKSYYFKKICFFKVNNEEKLRTPFPVWEIY